jgi:hypothetical protein
MARNRIEGHGGLVEKSIEIFEWLGAAPALAETDTLLQQATELTS